MKIKNKIINILMIIIVLTNISVTSKANTIDTSIRIIAAWYGDIPYSYKNEEKKAVRRAYDNTPVYIMKKSNECGYFYPIAVEEYKNEKVKNIIKNGYGYKTEEELNCLNVEEAFLATQEAIYIELENRNIEDYVITGLQGERIINATKQILQAAKEEEKVDIIEIVIQDEMWKEYEKNTDYKYKEIKINMKNSEIGKVEIIEGEDIKIIDEKGSKKEKIKNEDKLYLLVPKNIDQEVKIKISYEKEGVILYACEKENEENNRYLLAADGIETIEEEINISVSGNSIIEITNTDKNTQMPIKGNQYLIIKEDGSIVKQNLLTNEEGQIKLTLDKGKYYLKQKESIEEYDLSKALIEICIENKEKVKINVESTKSIVKEITTTNKEINVVEENEKIVENNITEISNITNNNINKEIINQTNETNLNNVNNFINTINRNNETNLKKENIYENIIEEDNVYNDIIEGKKEKLTMTRKDYMNYIDLVMLESLKVPVLPVASK